ncbi:hypothetical protein BBK77_012355 [Agrobacterium vitis]|nr:hypothetical protein [Agrobacterium vitis]
MDDRENEIQRIRESTIKRVIGPTILLGSGTYFDFESPESSEITIKDIAYGLAFEGRFAGQCYSRILKKRVLYVVAEHCVRMSYAVEQQHALAALMHECAESVCGDMTGPLKSMNPSYKATEKRCERAILNRFNVVISDPLAIKHADVRMLATERRDLMCWHGEKWTNDDIATPYDFEIIPWEPEEAAKAFLNRFFELAPTQENPQ